jgi:hypothetical protein
MIISKSKGKNKHKNKSKGKNKVFTPKKTLNTKIHQKLYVKHTKHIKHTQYKKTTVNHKYFIISECYNQNNNYLLTKDLRKYLKEYNFIEYQDIRNYDLKLLQQRKINIYQDKNCNNLLQLTKQTKLPQYITNKTYEFIWLNPIEIKIDKRIANIKANIKNIINDAKTHCIYNKSILYKNMMLECNTLAKRHLALTFPINKYSEYDFKDKHYILRPVDSFAGKDILYISSKKELDNAEKYFFNNGITIGSALKL